MLLCDNFVIVVHADVNKSDWAFCICKLCSTIFAFHQNNVNILQTFVQTCVSVKGACLVYGQIIHCLYFVTLFDECFIYVMKNIGMRT